MHSKLKSQSFTSHQLLLQSNVWQISLGTTLIFAPVLAKMLRIHRIFQNPRASKKVSIWFSDSN